MEKYGRYVEYKQSINQLIRGIWARMVKNCINANDNFPSYY